MVSGESGAGFDAVRFTHRILRNMQREYFKILAFPLIKWVDRLCRAEFIRPTAIIPTGDVIRLGCDA